MQLIFTYEFLKLYVTLCECKTLRIKYVNALMKLAIYIGCGQSYRQSKAKSFCYTVDCILLCRLYIKKAIMLP